ncbi:aldo/keto reductase, partial [Burkholderia cenocepacia]|uniref:aldo/keto reductase n=1 Tax=Burkholderia cenocepacia TaxID=95486 RepID=UPI001FC8748F
MEYRTLGRSGLQVPVLSFGAGTFGGTGPLFSAWGNTGVDEARRLIDICLDAGVNLFDTADVYSDGASERVLGAALKGRRDQVLISTKTGLPTGDGPNDAGTSRARLVRAVDDALRRLSRGGVKEPGMGGVMAPAEPGVKRGFERFQGCGF